MDSDATPLDDIRTYLRHANHKLANDEFGSCAPVDFAASTYGHILVDKIRTTDVAQDPQLAQQLLDHPLAAIRRAFLHSVYHHRPADEALCTQVELRLVNAGETDSWIRSLIATHTRSVDCAKALRGCPEATVRRALAARGVVLEDAKIPVQANSQEEMLEQARNTPAWGTTRTHGEYDEPLFRTEATAGRLGAWLDRSTANPDDISTAELEAGREALTALVAALRASERPKSGVQTVNEKMCWPVHALAADLYGNSGVAPACT